MKNKLSKWIHSLTQRLIKNDSYKEGFSVVTSIAKAKPLYKELILKAHPDRNADKHELAIELTELINNAKYNYEELLNLKKRVINELSIKE